MHHHQDTYRSETNYLSNVQEYVSIQGCMRMKWVLVSVRQRLRILWRFSGLLPREKPLVRQWPWGLLNQHGAILASWADLSDSNVSSIFCLTLKSLVNFWCTCSGKVRSSSPTKQDYNPWYLSEIYSHRHGSRTLNNLRQGWSASTKSCMILSSWSKLLWYIFWVQRSRAWEQPPPDDRHA